MGPLFAGAEDGLNELRPIMLGFVCCVMLSPAAFVVFCYLFFWAFLRVHRSADPPAPKE